MTTKKDLKPFIDKWIAFSFSSDKKVFIDKVYNHIIKIIGNDFADDIFYDLSDNYRDKVYNLKLKEDYEKIYKSASLCVIFYSKEYISGKNCIREFDIIKNNKIDKNKLNEYVIIECDDIEDRNRFDWEEELIKLFEKKNTIDEISYQILLKARNLTKNNFFISRTQDRYLELMGKFKSRYNPLEGDYFFKILKASKTYQEFITSIRFNSIIFFEGPLFTGKSTFLKIFDHLYSEPKKHYHFLPPLLLYQKLASGEFNFKEMSFIEKKGIVLKTLHDIILSYFHQQIQNNNEAINVGNLLIKNNITFDITYNDEETILKEFILILNEMFSIAKSIQRKFIFLPLDEIYKVLDLQDVYYDLINDFEKINNCDTIKSTKFNFKFIIITNTLFYNEIKDSRKLRKLNRFKTYLINIAEIKNILDLLELDFKEKSNYIDYVCEMTNGHPFFFERFLELYLTERTEKRNVDSPLMLSKKVFEDPNFLDNDITNRISDSIKHFANDFRKESLDFIRLIKTRSINEKKSYASFYNNPILQVTGIVNYNYEYHQKFLGDQNINKITNKFIEKNIDVFEEIIDD